MPVTFTPGRFKPKQPPSHAINRPSRSNSRPLARLLCARYVETMPSLLNFMIRSLVVAEIDVAFSIHGRSFSEGHRCRNLRLLARDRQRQYQTNKEHRRHENRNRAIGPGHSASLPSRARSVKGSVWPTFALSRGASVTGLRRRLQRGVMRRICQFRFHTGHLDAPIILAGRFEPGLCRAPVCRSTRRPRATQSPLGDSDQ